MGRVKQFDSKPFIMPFKLSILVHFGQRWVLHVIIYEISVEGNLWQILDLVTVCVYLQKYIEIPDKSSTEWIMQTEGMHENKWFIVNYMVIKLYSKEFLSNIRTYTTIL